MSWIEIILSFLLALFRMEGTIILWSVKGIPYWQSLLLAVCWTSLTSATTYYGTSILVGWLKKWWVLKILMEGWEREVLRYKNNFSNSLSKKRDIWLSQTKKGILIFLAFFPLTQLLYCFPSAIIATIKIVGMRHGILIVLIGNAVRWLGITTLIYLGFQLFE